MTNLIPVKILIEEKINEKTGTRNIYFQDKKGNKYNLGISYDWLIVDTDKERKKKAARYAKWDKEFKERLEKERLGKETKKQKTLLQRIKDFL